MFRFKMLISTVVLIIGSFAMSGSVSAQPPGVQVTIYGWDPVPRGVPEIIEFGGFGGARPECVARWDTIWEAQNTVSMAIECDQPTALTFNFYAYIGEEGRDGPIGAYVTTSRVSTNRDGTLYLYITPTRSSGISVWDITAVEVSDADVTPLSFPFRYEWR